MSYMFLNNGYIAVKIGQVYYLARPLEELNAIQKLKSIKQHKNKDKLLYIYPNIQKAEEHLGKISKNILYKIILLSNTNIVLKIKTNNNPNWVSIMINDNIQVPVVATSANPRGNIPALNIDHIKHYFPNIIINKSLEITEGYLEPAVLEIHPNSIVVVAPGEISYVELNNIFPDSKIQKKISLHKYSFRELSLHYKSGENIITIGSQTHPNTYFNKMLKIFWENKNSKTLRILKPNWNKQDLLEVFDFTLQRYFNVVS